MEEIVKGGKLPAMNDVKKIAKDGSANFEETIVRVAGEVESYLEPKIRSLISAIEIVVEEEGKVFIIPEGIFSNENDAFVRRKTMEIVVRDLKVNGFDASYKQPRSENDNWSVRISKG